jgi:flagellar basal-body rod modification protein FlgD
MQMNTTGAGAFTWPATTKQSYSRNQVSGADAAAAAPVVKGASAAGYADSVVKDDGVVAGADTADGTEDRFLKLLVAQMRNQDPLNPLYNAQVTSQLAQISTVRGIEGLNKTMSDFVTANVQGSAMSSVAMLGKQVLVAGDSFAYQPPAAGAATRLGFELAEPATAVRLEVVDANGTVVHTRTMASVPAGVQTFEWDGKSGSGAAVPAGPLSVRIGALDGKVAVEATTLVPARVVGIGQSAGATQLELDGRAPVAPSDVRLIL